MVVIVVMRRMRSRKEVEFLNFHQERTPHEGEHPTVTSMYQSAYEMPEIQHRLSADISGHDEMDETFHGTAPARAANSTNARDGAQYSEITQGPAGDGYGVEGMYEEPERSSATATVKGTQKIKKKVAGTAEKGSASEPVNLHELYAQPDKSKKTQKGKAGDNGKGLNKTPGPDQLYAQPDKTKKSGKRQSNQQQLQPVADPDQLYTQPNKTHSAAGMYETGENMEGPPDPPPPYVPVEEQYYNTRSGAGPPSQERNYDYAELDWSHK